MTEVESTSPEETERVAAGLAAELVPGDVVTVSGELGTGKTTFVRGACRALGVTSPVTSPTFTVGHRYSGTRSRHPAPNGITHLTVSHLDLYRFQGMSDEEWGNLEPYFEDAVVFVEWPEAAGGYLPPVRAEVRLRHLGGDRRLLTLERAPARV